MPSKRYAVGGSPAQTLTTPPRVSACLWNPHATKPIFAREIHWSSVSTAASNEIGLARTTTRGTPGSTVIPDADNDFDRIQAPDSGAVLDLSSYTVDPTISASRVGRSQMSNQLGAAVTWVFRKPCKIPAGTGLAIVSSGGGANAVNTCGVAFVWDE